jgi:hypothetical protein
MMSNDAPVIRRDSGLRPSDVKAAVKAAIEAGYGVEIYRDRIVIKKAPDSANDDNGDNEWDGV